MSEYFGFYYTDKYQKNRIIYTNVPLSKDKEQWIEDEDGNEYILTSKGDSYVIEPLIIDYDWWKK
jgi:hypothetical protein